MSWQISKGQVEWEEGMCHRARHETGGFRKVWAGEEVGQFSHSNTQRERDRIQNTHFTSHALSLPLSPLHLSSLRFYHSGNPLPVFIRQDAVQVQRISHC